MGNSTLPFPCPFCGAHNSLKAVKGIGIVCKICLTPTGIFGTSEFVCKTVIIEKVPLEKNIIVLENLGQWIKSIAIGNIDAKHKSVIVGLSNGDLRPYKFFRPQANKIVKWTMVGGLRLSSEILKVILTDLNGDGLDEIIALDSSGNIVIGNYEKLYHKRILDVKDVAISNFYFNKKRSILLINSKKELIALDLDASELLRYKLGELGEEGSINIIVNGDLDGDEVEELCIVQSGIKLFITSITENRIFKRKKIYCKKFKEFKDNIISILTMDTNNDGMCELIVATKNGLYCYDHTGERLWRHDVPNIVNIIVGDLNNDNRREITILTEEGNVIILSPRGIEIEKIKIPLDIFEQITCGTIGDADNDSFEELLIGTTKGKIIMVKFLLTY